MGNFKPTKNRTSLISNDVVEKHRYNLTLNGQKVLFGLAQSIDHTLDLFNEVEIDIQAFFKYLDVENRNDRYQIVRDAFFDITEHPLQHSTNDAKRWSSIPWMSVDYDGDSSNYVKIQFTDKAKPFLLQLNGYVKIQGKHITSLQSRYATWLYPVMKMIQGKYFGQLVIPIARLMEITFTDNKKEHPAYHNPTSGKNNFLKRVLGLKKINGVFTIVGGSPLDNINKETDITISAEVLKTGRSYDRILFYVESKKQAQPRKVSAAAGVRKVATLKQETLPHRFLMSEVYAYAKASNQSVDDWMKVAGYKISGKYAVKGNEVWVADQRKNTLFSSAIEELRNGENE